MNIEVKTLSSLEKVFPCGEISAKEYTEFSCLKGEIFSYQTAYRITGIDRIAAKVEIKSPLSEYIKVYTVNNVPMGKPAYPTSDDYYLTKDVCLVPDLLEEYPGVFSLLYNQWRTLWIEVSVPENIDAGDYYISIDLTDEENNVVAESSFRLEIIDKLLPKQKILSTHWFHNDCLCTYYGVEVFSDRYWEILGNYMENYRKYGSNMILTPIFTPPLDTEIGSERPTVQLVDVEETDTGYRFGFDKLDRYIDLAKEKGITHFEISHFFTQWGAKATPKIVTTAGKRIFGWDVSASSREYTEFINALIPQLKEFLKNKGVFDNCYFHISDEPTYENMDTYSKALNVVKEALSDCHVMDALSDYAFYSEGLVKTPVSSNNHIQSFIDHNVSPLWAYYCCSQNADYVSNAFMSMPSARNRILGLQLFKYDIEGFLQWGYNFWYSQYSKFPINPFVTTDAAGAFPSGDSYLVYPGSNGIPEPSLREIVFNEAMQDARALLLLEEHMGHDNTVKWIEERSGQEISFTDYPHGSEYILNLRRDINNKIKSMP